MLWSLVSCSRNLSRLFPDWFCPGFLVPRLGRSTTSGAVPKKVRAPQPTPRVASGHHRKTNPGDNKRRRHKQKRNQNKIINKKQGDTYQFPYHLQWHQIPLLPSQKQVSAAVAVAVAVAGCRSRSPLRMTSRSRPSLSANSLLVVLFSSAVRSEPRRARQLFFLQSAIKRRVVSQLVNKPNERTMGRDELGPRCRVFAQRRPGGKKRGAQKKRIMSKQEQKVSLSL